MPKEIYLTDWIIEYKSGRDTVRKKVSGVVASGTKEELLQDTFTFKRVVRKLSPKEKASARPINIIFNKFISESNKT